MSPTTATTIAASAMLAAPLAKEQPAYRYVGHGAFLPANAAAWREVDAYAAMITARSAATRSAAQ